MRACHTLVLYPDRAGFPDSSQICLKSGVSKEVFVCSFVFIFVCFVLIFIFVLLASGRVRSTPWMLNKLLMKWNNFISMYANWTNEQPKCTSYFLFLLPSFTFFPNCKSSIPKPSVSFIHSFIHTLIHTFIHSCVLLVTKQISICALLTISQTHDKGILMPWLLSRKQSHRGKQ